MSKQKCEMQKDLRLFIAGGTGLIGSACLDFCSTIPEIKIFAPKRSELDFLQKDLLVEYMLSNKITHGIFASGFNGGIRLNMEQPAELIIKNSLLAINAMSASHEAKLDRMIVFGSSCVYPVNASQPYEETSIMTGPLEESSRAYSTSKLLLIQTALSFNSQHPDNTLFLPIIPNTVFGPNDNFDPNSSHVVGALIFKIHHAKKNGALNVDLWGSGLVKREFVYSGDVARACVKLLLHRNLQITLPINVTSGEEVTIASLAQIIAQVIGFEGTINWDRTMPDGVNRKALDDRKLRNLGWQAETSFITGIKNTYHWFLKSEWA